MRDTLNYPRGNITEMEEERQKIEVSNKTRGWLLILVGKYSTGWESLLFSTAPNLCIKKLKFLK